MATDTLVSRFSFSSLLAALLAGCAGADAVPLAEATVDNLGQVHVPGLIPAWRSAWSRDAVYVREEDEMGLPRVVRYRIVRP